jgi:DNA-binding CsgD family transcriptional regulator
LVISGLTVKTHIGRVSTLGVFDRAAAILFAYEHRLVTPG